MQCNFPICTNLNVIDDVPFSRPSSRSGAVECVAVNSCPLPDLLADARQKGIGRIGSVSAFFAHSVSFNSWKMPHSACRRVCVWLRVTWLKCVHLNRLLKQLYWFDMMSSRQFTLRFPSSSFFLKRNSMALFDVDVFHVSVLRLCECIITSSCSPCETLFFHSNRTHGDEQQTDGLRGKSVWCAVFSALIRFCGWVYATTRYEVAWSLVFVRHFI